MGGEPERKKPSRPADKFKFKFDWDKDQDTSQDLNPLYENPHEGALLFGRGLRAGIDRRAQMRDNSHAQMALIAKSREDAGRAMSREELRRAEARADADDAQRERDERQTTRTHWSEKSLEDMNERDWRIFREDHSITTRGVNSRVRCDRGRRRRCPSRLYAPSRRRGTPSPVPFRWRPSPSVC